MDCSVFRCCGIKTERKDWDLVYSHWHLHAKGTLANRSCIWGRSSFTVLVFFYHGFFWFFFFGLGDRRGN